MMTKTAKIDGHNTCKTDWEEGDAEKRKPQMKLPKQKFWIDQNTVMVFTAQTILFLDVMLEAKPILVYKTCLMKPQVKMMTRLSSFF